jgi:hypothetical protein
VIKRLLFLAALAGAVWWLLTRREGGREPGAVVGYGDGSSLALDEGSPELERLLGIARGVVRA